MTNNPNFVEEVSPHFGKDNEIIVGCQTGKRLLMVTTDLLSTESCQQQYRMIHSTKLQKTAADILDQLIGPIF
ncbi:hypothetical protein HHK36_003290 [Tetracentron sinense]|uniref:Uncharacterized protein n=1 Tax=Tetracentron sinense TaxID=13715 RepID=A0A834ZT28_TETSI|nr:hypothetical protein HHK36_003290 [Tetracentron sinense]